MHSAIVGLGLGFSVSVQFGPMSLFLIRSTLRGGCLVGLAIGAGIAVIDGAYAACGAAGAAPFLSIEPIRLALGIAGGLFLIVLALRTLRAAWHVRLGAEDPSDVATPMRAFLTALGGTASNPVTIVSWAAIFAAASTAGAARSTGAAVLLVLGVAVGSASWLTLLTGGTAVAGRRLGDRALRLADAAAGLGMLGLGGALTYASVHDR